MAFVDDNLMTVGGGISHHDEFLAVDEDLSPSLENMIVLHWLKLIHQDLPRLVKQRYDSELRSRTLASLNPARDISSYQFLVGRDTLHL